MRKQASTEAQLQELLYQTLETKLGGKHIYHTVLPCVLDEDLKQEWQEYLKQTITDVQILLTAFDKLGRAPESMSPGRDLVAHFGTS